MCAYIYIYYVLDTNVWFGFSSIKLFFIEKSLLHQYSTVSFFFQALFHPYFKNKPRPTPLGSLPKHKKPEVPTLKRRASSLFSDDSDVLLIEGPKVKKIARKLNFDDPLPSGESSQELVPTPPPRLRRGDSGYKSQQNA